MASYEIVIKNDQKRDPHPGVYALQRWAALAISSDPNSYQDPALREKALRRYGEFLDRAEANAVPRDLIKKVNNAVRMQRTHANDM